MDLFDGKSHTVDDHTQRSDHKAEPFCAVKPNIKLLNMLISLSFHSSSWNCLTIVKLRKSDFKKKNNGKTFPAAT